ncbi:MAG: ABC transporter ATP-binding protein, partial [Bacteroidales bacterium]|nr:ABC transporter ATP-binding protein [Bacteroidales bacterium]
MIKLENVDFAYSSYKQIFRQLNLRLEPGHIYGLLGKNGAGKSTMLKIISGLNFATSGNVETLGYQASRRDARMLQDIFFVPEEIAVPQQSIENFVRINAPFYPNFSQSDFDKYMNMFEMGEYKQKMSSLSHGQKKKVIISFAIACNTRILILDEPTNGMDIPSKSTFRRIVSTCISEDSSIIISTHQVRDLQDIIDSVIILHESEIKLLESIGDITEAFAFKHVSSETCSQILEKG